MEPALRAADIESIIPRPPVDIVPVRNAFADMVAGQWDRHVPRAPVGIPLGAAHPQSVKPRFIAEMYVRACYSMLLLSARGPLQLRLPVRTAATLPISRTAVIVLGEGLISGLSRLLPQTLHRQLLLTSALMGTFDVLLDETAGFGEVAVARIASLITLQAPTDVRSAERPIVAITEMIRHRESAWQAGYWDAVLVPAVHEYCLAEARAVSRTPDPTGMGHRRAGFDSAIKGMWYVVGPQMGLCRGSAQFHAQFETAAWNREQRWMFDTSLLMQMIDDWVDQDEDGGVRTTPVAEGSWGIESVERLYRKTVSDQAAILTENGIRNRVLQQLFADLYNDYLHAALEAMRTGVAA